VNNLTLEISPSTAQNGLLEVRDIVSNLDWQLGDTVLFSCSGAPHLYTNGIKWAVETKSGHFIYQTDSKE